jgi:hypothetical protein
MLEDGQDFRQRTGARCRTRGSYDDMILELKFEIIPGVGSFQTKSLAKSLDMIYFEECCNINGVAEILPSCWHVEGDQVLYLVQRGLRAQQCILTPREPDHVKLCEGMNFK